MRHTTITHTALFHLLAPRAGNPATPVVAKLSWSTRTPFEVAMLFRVPTASTGRPVWIMARELLADGLTRRSGEGDITIKPTWCRGNIELTLDAPSGHAVFLMERAEVTKFLDATYKLVPAGAEAPAVTDQELRKLTTT